MKSSTQTVELRKRDVDMLDAIINGKKWLEAATHVAGYATPNRDAVHVFTDPRALAYAYRRTRGRLTIEGAPAAFNLMLRVMNDENRDMRLRIDIAKHLFAAAGFTPPKAAEPQDSEDKADLKDMTPQQVQHFVTSISAELERRKAKAAAKQPIEDIF